MTEFKLLAALVRLKILKQSIKKYTPILSKMSSTYQLLTPEILVDLSRTKINKFADFRLFWKKRFPSLINTEAYSVGDTLKDIKAEFIEIKNLSTETLYDVTHDHIIALGFVNISETAADAKDLAALQQLSSQVALLKDLKTGDNSLTQLNIADPEQYAHFKHTQSILKKSKKNFEISTGFPTLDAFLDGGQKNQRIGLMLALPKRFKTSLCLTFLIHGFRKGFNATMISLENVIADTDTKINKILPVNNLHRIKEKYSYDNDFDVLYRPPFTFGLTDLRSYLEEKVKINRLPHIICLDFLDLMLAEEKFKEDYLTQNRIIYGLKALANEFNVFIWAVSQGTRQGVSANSLQIDHVGRDFSRIAGADFIISLNQSKYQKAARMLSISLLEGRWTDWGSKIRTDKLLLMMRKDTLLFKEVTQEQLESLPSFKPKNKKKTATTKFQELQGKKR